MSKAWMKTPNVLRTPSRPFCCWDEAIVEIRGGCEDSAWDEGCREKPSTDSDDCVGEFDARAQTMNGVFGTGGADGRFLLEDRVRVPDIRPTLSSPAFPSLSHPPELDTHRSRMARRNFEGA